jgi:hypothetical protein
MTKRQAIEVLDNGMHDIMGCKVFHSVGRQLYLVEISDKSSLCT